MGGKVNCTRNVDRRRGILLDGGNKVARHTLIEAIQRAWEHEYCYNLMTAFYYFVELLMQEDKAADLPMTTAPKEFALALLSCVRTQPATWQVFKDKAVQLQAEIENALPMEMCAVAIVRGKGSMLEEMVNAVLGGNGGGVRSGLKLDC